MKDFRMIYDSASNTEQQNAFSFFSRLRFRLHKRAEDADIDPRRIYIWASLDLGDPFREPIEADWTYMKQLSHAVLENIEDCSFYQCLNHRQDAIWIPKELRCDEEYSTLSAKLKETCPPRTALSTYCAGIYLILKR